MKPRSQFDGNVVKLQEFVELSPLADFPYAVRPITEKIYCAGNGWYLLVGVRGNRNDGRPDDTIRACMIIWATDVSSAILISRCEDPIPSAQFEPAELPPVTYFLEKSTGWRYGELLKAGHSKFMESAVYGSGGGFEFKQLRLRNAIVYFRSRTKKNSELPFGISLITGREER
jgi:hypothetical protein